MTANTNMTVIGGRTLLDGVLEIHVGANTAVCRRLTQVLFLQAVTHAVILKPYTLGVGPTKPRTVRQGNHSWFVKFN